MSLGAFWPAHYSWRLGTGVRGRRVGGRYGKVITNKDSDITWSLPAHTAPTGVQVVPMTPVYP